MTITCPHCGLSGQLDDSKRPAGATSINCPRCKQSFPLPPLESVALPTAPPTPEAASLRPCPSCGGIIEGSGGLCNACEAARSRQPGQGNGINTLPPPLPATEERNSGVCTVCKGHFAQSEMVRFGNKLVCASCKPTYVQMLAMGMGTIGDLRYAGFWIRFGAKCIDGLILWVVNFATTMATTFLIASNNSPQMAIVAGIMNVCIQIGIGIGYNIYFLSGKYQATPGKLACGLKVVTADGDKISAGRAVGRYFAEMLSGMILLIGYIMAAFDDEKRTLHDRICNTRVVFK
ncbi:zinc-ribbon domain-containing protein [Trichlorobacter lovleyi]|uniref:RDD family protein n=1 Tax=Trichlorobacter lovleyi TaxID=313985 RepID=UPI002240484E|nr:RDD family protein [Trichlorobacter lovleyi]QOX80756.1 zinc-ribbon domain-containing protein [Trichlorobacter lovleyi]